nr:MAG TPA: ASCH domain protein [Caudoviricetes sp.]
MKKIMFNDKFHLTKAVLNGRKTMTRRIISYPSKFRGENVAGYFVCRSPSGEIVEVCLHDEDERMIDGGQILPKYKVGEVVAIAQSYNDCGNMPDYELDEDGYPIMPKRSGFFNKMFVKADLMPHHIKITDIKVERLQDISDEDCMKEGIEEHLKGIQYGFPSNIGYIGQYPFSNPREAFSALIDKVSGKGAWECNPFVWAYEFELID